jgi:hypothetical protein
MSATEGTVGVDEATAIVSEKGARAIETFRQARATGCTQGDGSGDGFAFRQIRRAACQLELTALRSTNAVALDWPIGQFVIDRAHIGNHSHNTIGATLLHFDAVSKKALPDEAGSAF